METKEIKQLVKKLAKRDALVIRLLYETGCSIEELTRIRTKDIRKDSIVFGKRVSMISVELAKECFNYYQKNNLLSNDYLFKTRQSATITPKRIAQLVNAATAQSSLGPKKPFWLRQLHIRDAASHGLNPKQISSQIGISEVRVMQILSEFQQPQKDYQVMFQ